MPLNKETEAILKDLETSGFDLSSVRQQINVNPILENQANSKLGGALLRREEYTKYKEAKETEVTNLQKQVRELASAHDSLGSFKGNDALYEAALDKIAILEENLIANGFPPEEVRNLSHNEKTQLQNAVTQAREKEAGKEKELEMPNDKKDYLDVETFQTAAANMIGGNMISTVRIQRALQKADKLGIEITPELERKFEQSLLQGAEQQKSFEQIADETFGFSTKEKEIADKRVQESIEARARELTAERLKEAGVPESVARTNRPKSIMDSYNGRLGNNPNDDAALKGEGGTVLVRGRQLPANKFGDAEYYKMRGDRSSRIQHAMQSINELQEKRPELFEDVY